MARSRKSTPKRRSNRDVGDIVLVAEQYYSAQQEELDAMKHGTAQELSDARAQTKKLKKSLQKLTGSNQVLYGSMGGGTVGAALGALTGNPFLSAIGSLTGSLLGSVVARPSLPSERVESRSRRDDRDERSGRGGDVIPFPRRSSRGRGGGGYAANPGLKRRLTEL